MDENNVYYVVQKGNAVGFYKNLNDCQNQDGFSIFGTDATIYKGYNLSKEGEQYLASHGLHNATYSISAANLTDDLFGELLPCPLEVGDNTFLPSASRGEMTEEYSKSKRPQEVSETTERVCMGTVQQALETTRHAYVGTINHQSSTNSSDYSSAKKPQQALDTSNNASFILEFDGASKGNPGPAGAGAILRAEDGSVVCRLREGVGIATNNVAEYRSVILGLKHALNNGIKHIRVQGDSKLVCMQIQGLWKIKNQNMAALCKVAKELKDKFLSFEINHIPRELNSEADAQANGGVYLRDREIEEDCRHK